MRQHWRASSMAALFLFALAGLARAGEQADAETLKRLVHQDCGACHGLTLAGGLGPDLRPAALADYQPQVLEQVILDGVPGTAMPPWRPLLSEEDAQWIAAYLMNGVAE